MTHAIQRGLDATDTPDVAVVGSHHRGITAARLGTYLLFLLLTIFFVLPLVIVVSTSLKQGTEVFSDPGIIPSNPGLENYQSLLGSQAAFVKWFTNSAIVSVIGTVLVLALTSLSAYAFARIDFRFKSVVFGLLIATLSLPAVMFLVPQSRLVGELGLYDTLPAYMLPGLAGVFGVFFMRQFFLGIPLELEEAAYVDGASRLRTLVSIVVPMSAPALATLGVITFLTFWNDYLWPLVVCQRNCTLPPGLRQLQGTFTAEYGLLMAGAVVAAIPVLIIYVLLQRYIVQSVASSGIKG